MTFFFQLPRSIHHLALDRIILFFRKEHEIVESGDSGITSYSGIQQYIWGLRAIVLAAEMRFRVIHIVLYCKEKNAKGSSYQTSFQGAKIGCIQF